MDKTARKGPGRAALYYRYSTAEQENSLARQKSQVEPYTLQKGYAVVATEQDLGIPGNEYENRPGFLRLMEMARRREIDVIVCDDQDRFSRFNPLKFCAVMSELDEAGVRLETVSTGVIDTENFMGLMMAQLRQH